MKSTNQQRTLASSSPVILRRADRHIPAGWTARGWRRAWKRGQTHNGVPVE